MSRCTAGTRLLAVFLNDCPVTRPLHARYTPVTPRWQFLKECMECLTFDKFDGAFDTAIKGYGLDLKVSQVHAASRECNRAAKSVVAT